MGTDSGARPAAVRRERKQPKAAPVPVGRRGGAGSWNKSQEGLPGSSWSGLQRMEAGNGKGEGGRGMRRGFLRPRPRSSCAGGPGTSATLQAAAALLYDMKGCYSRLRALVPTLPRHRRVSKVELLQHVIDYIWDLQLELQCGPPAPLRPALLTDSTGVPWTLLPPICALSFPGMSLLPAPVPSPAPSGKC
uniref:DNA-binding protein inhibitor ID-4 n=1 Tax=Serinus canaria TaxID=9135 RepID=A0A8C9NNU3_SERCA